MTITDIRNILEAPYNRTVWKSFIQTQFSNAELLVNEANLNLGKSDIYSNCFSLGNYKLDDYNKIGIYEVILKPNVNLNRNRVGLRDLMKILIGQQPAIMVVFVQDDKWRFSYISKRKVRNAETNTIEDKETAPKRYTYLFGKNEKALTAATRFDKLISDQKKNLFQNLTLNDFEDAFSVEKLSKEFFAKYKEIYENFVEFITGKRFVKKGSKWTETTTCQPNFQLKYFDNDEKLARDFFKRMMGRIVFLYFIQKKGWLACPMKNEKEINWGAGDQEYMFNLYKNAEYKDSFYSEYLVPLFFETLNNPKSSQSFNQKNQGSDNVFFPYLNGGLFDKSQDYKYDKIALPSIHFKTLFNTFNEYNFTIYEDAPDEHTVAVDPEMLGHIFENLLEDNKDKGAFYTPKDIVHYMCRESLHNYIYTYTHNEDNETFKTKLKQYNDTYDVNLFDKNEIKQIDRALEDVKICDPAIGSGAFPMGLLHEIYNLKIPIEDQKGFKAKSPADLKKHIIEESIYGVDIDNGAVDIARLRFWLSLVVDETEPQPLPNLDFKIVCANTLIPSGYDSFLKLAEETQTPTLLKMDGEIQKLQGIRDRYFEIKKEVKNPKEEKEKLQSEFLQTRNYIVNEFKSLRKSWNLGDFIEKISEWQPFKDKSCTWFDAWWMFGVKDGFDIVIGNPPYGVPFNAIEKEIFRKKYISTNTTKDYKGSLDSYTIFIEKGFNLLKKNGNLHFIVPISITSSDSVSSLHNLLINNCKKIQVSSYSVRPQPVFENAVVNTSILFFTKTNTKNEKLLSTKMYRKNNELNLRHLVDNLEFIDIKNYTLQGRFPKISYVIEKNILEKILNQNTKIRDLILPNSKSIYYRFAGGRYFKVITNYSTGSSAERGISLDEKYANAIGAILSSNLFFWFYQIFSDNLNIKSYEIEEFSLPKEKLSKEIIQNIEEVYERYLLDIENNANIRETKKYANIDSFKEYKIGKSKHLIDIIDDIICPLYGLTQEETIFIKNYEIDFRLQNED